MKCIAFLALAVVASAAIQKSFNGELVDGEFIVVFKSDITDAQREAHMNHPSLASSKLIAEYSTAIKGYAVEADESSMLTLSEDPVVAYVEQNQVARALCNELDRPGTGLYGLRRASSTSRGGSNPLRTRGGDGVDVYIIDTGIQTTHEDFGNRAVHAFDCTGQGSGDGNGHGTHCAGTAAGHQYGIAPEANLFAVKVLNSAGSGTFACVISGIEYVAAQSGNRVGSLSLGGGFSAAVNDAVNGAVNAGAAMSSASGNSNANACNFSPASAELGVCVNSHDANDARSSFSNFGTCSDIFAAGTNVLSAWIGGNTATRTISGTSMACPHVSGVIAETWGRNPSWSGAAVQEAVIAAGQSNVVTNPGTGSPNLLAQTSCAGAN